MDIENSFAAYCSHCNTLVSLPVAGVCPSCGEKAEAYRDYLLGTVEQAVRKEKFCKKHETFQFRSFSVRGAAEYGCTSDDVFFLAARMLKRHEEINLVLGTERPLFQALPKLDVVWQVFRNVEYGESTAIYEDPFTPRLYMHWRHAHQAYSAEQVMSDLLDSPVFPRSDEKGLSGPKFFELLPVLYGQKYLDSLWRTLVHQGFYLLPEEAVLDPNL